MNGSTRTEFGDLVEPSPKNAKPSESHVKDSAKNDEDFEAAVPRETDEQNDEESTPALASIAEVKAGTPKKKLVFEDKAEDAVPVAAPPSAVPAQEPIGVLLVRLLGSDHPAYPSKKSQDIAIAKLAEFDADQPLRKALEWVLTTDGTEWGYELKENSAHPHARLSKVRDRVVQEHRAANKPANRQKAQPIRRRLAYGNPMTLEDMKFRIVVARESNRFRDQGNPMTRENENRLDQALRAIAKGDQHFAYENLVTEEDMNRLVEELKTDGIDIAERELAVA